MIEGYQLWVFIDEFMIRIPSILPGYKLTPVFPPFSTVTQRNVLNNEQVSNKANNSKLSTHPYPKFPDISVINITEYRGGFIFDF